MDITIKKSKVKKSTAVNITGSKSETNRLLLLKALYPSLKIENISNSDDSVLMQKALQSKDEVIDIHHAGTAMRFLTAYFSVQNDRKVIITGSSRMKERPIKVLVDALTNLGANIDYLEKDGFPPLKIRGKELSVNEVTLAANISSQYVSALLLIASKLDNGLTINLEGKMTSVPYIKMTLDLLNQVGIKTNFKGNSIMVNSQDREVKPKTLTVESDWSSASYFYSITALSDVGTEIQLSAYKENSLQGDSVLAEIYKQFGVQTRFANNSMQVIKTSGVNQNTVVKLDLSNAPDIAQTIVVTAFGLGLECYLSGLHTLKIKETDRLVALKTELEKFGAEVSITPESLHLKSTQVIQDNVSVSTYNDHRMAMAFAPLALMKNIHIKDANVVSKSYPQFWRDLKAIGFNLK